MSLWEDPEPRFNILDDNFYPPQKNPEPETEPTMEEAVRRMQTPELKRFRPREPTIDLPLFEAGNSYWRSQARVFSCFALLVPEVRKRIWSITVANDARVIEMRHPDLQILHKDGRRTSRPETLIKPRALLSVCVEAREEQIKALREIDLGTLETCLINLEIDTIYFGPNSFWYNQILWRPTHGMKEEQAWKKRQEFNHWRAGEDTGQESIYDPNQNRDQIRHFFDNYHPFLCNKDYESERKQIQNVAFDLEFWNETWERRVGGQRNLMSRFPNVKTFILAAGDLGASYNLTKSDNGPEKLMEESYRQRLTVHRTMDQPGVFHIGQVGLLLGAAQTPLTEEVIEVTELIDQYPTPVTMCVTRGGDYLGHECRFVPVPVDDDEDDDDDLSYEDTTLDKYPNITLQLQNFKKEIEDLQDDLINITNVELELLEEWLPCQATAELFHLDAGRSADQEPGDVTESSNDDEANDPIEVIPAPIPTREGEETATQEASKETTDPVVEPFQEIRNGEPEVASASATQPSNIQPSSKINSTGSSRSFFKSPSSRKASPSNKANHRTAVEQGDRVAEIVSSKVHYGVLKYRVRWYGEGEPDMKVRYARTEPMFVENDYCKELIALFHMANPKADDLQTEARNERKAYRSVTKGGRRLSNVECPLTPSLPNGAISSSYISQESQNEERNGLMLMSGTLPMPVEPQFAVQEAAGQVGLGFYSTLGGSTDFTECLDY